jgi:DNA-binding beta-propeller fold protein YncE
MRLIGPAIAGVGIALASAGWAAGPAPLELEAKIPLGEVRGRIDHFSIDLGRQRLFVAELGNDSVGVIDLRARRLLHTITGLKEPQGVGYVPSTDMLYVANAGDGSVRLFRGAELTPTGRIDLGDDADNIRVDAEANRVYIGYGKGALAIVDPLSRARIGDIALKAHPEAFQLDRSGGRIFANLPDAGQIAVIDIAAAKQVTAWPVREARANFPMAFDDVSRQVAVVFRRPARLMVFTAQDGSVAANLEACGDADDVFVDARRHRLYLSCGEGVIDVMEKQGSGYARIARVPTVAGARTSLLVPEIDRLLVAVRATAREPAAIWVFRPVP